MLWKFTLCLSMENTQIRLLVATKTKKMQRESITSLLHGDILKNRNCFEIGISTGRIGMKNFDMEFYIKRNEDTAKRLYGNRLDENRRVKGTNIWFDAYWRIHTN